MKSFEMRGYFCIYCILIQKATVKIFCSLFLSQEYDNIISTVTQVKIHVFHHYAIISRQLLNIKATIR